MTVTSIEIVEEDGGTPSPWVPLDGFVTLEARPNSRVDFFDWSVTGGLEIVSGGQSDTVTIRGRRVDSQIGGSTISVTVDNGKLTVPMSLTVVSLDGIVAEIQATPPTGANTARAAFELPPPEPVVFVSTNNRLEQSREQSLLMVSGNFPPVTVTARVRPPGVPIVWSSARDPFDDELGDGLTLSATSGDSVDFQTDKRGAYFVRAEVKLRQGLGASTSMVKVLPVVLVDVTAVTDRSQFTPAFRPDTQLDFLHFASNDFRSDEERSRAFIYADGRDFAELEADVELVSGGRNKQLLLDDVRVEWIQTTRGPSSASSEVVGTYESGATVDARMVTSWFRRGLSYVFDLPVLDAFDFPVPDAQDDQVPPKVVGPGPTIRSLEGGGQLRTLHGRDLPSASVPTYFNGGDDDGDPLETVAVDMQFSAYLCIWTETVPRVFGVVHRIDWGLTGQWSIEEVSPLSAKETATPAVTNQATAISPTQPADRAGAEIWGPGNVDHVVLAQTKAGQ